LQNLKKRFKGFAGNQNRGLNMDKVLADKEKLASVLADNRRFSMFPKVCFDSQFYVFMSGKC